MEVHQPGTQMLAVHPFRHGLVVRVRNQQREAEAYALLRACYDKFTEGFDSADLRRAAALLATLGGHP